MKQPKWVKIVFIILIIVFIMGMVLPYAIR